LAPVRISFGCDLALRCAVTEDDAVGGLEFVERAVGGDVAALAVRYRHRDHLPGLASDRDGRLSVLDTQVHPFAAVLERVIAHQGTGQKMRLAEYLEAVADADHRLPLLGVASYRAHHRREAGDSAGPQVVAVREAARKDDAVVGGEIALAVP